MGVGAGAGSGDASTLRLRPAGLPLVLAPLEEQGFVLNIGCARNRESNGWLPPAAASGQFTTPVSASYHTKLAPGRTSMVVHSVGWGLPARGLTQVAVTLELEGGGAGVGGGECATTAHRRRCGPERRSG